MFVAKFEHTKQEFEPILSEETLNYHFEKHHIGYANSLNDLIKGTEFKDLSLEEIIIRSRKTNQKIFNPAAQLFNHDFYWKCMKRFNTQPQGKLAQLINSQFETFGNFCQQYIAYANTLFGSGWSWLVIQNNELKFVNTSNSENPIGTNAILLCVIDLWEHAYYIDYRNARIDYIKNFVFNCIDWEFCTSQLDYANPV